VLNHTTLALATTGTPGCDQRIRRAVDHIDPLC